MSRFITCLTLLLAIVTLASAQVKTINTPNGDITQGATVKITWELMAPVNNLGNLRAVNKATQGSTTISDTLDLNALSLDWVVNVDPGNYNFALNDGSGDKYSGPFNVVAPPAAKDPANKTPNKTPAAEPSQPPKAPAEPNEPKNPKVSNQEATTPPNSSGNSVTLVYDLLLSLIGVATLMTYSA
ncbi:1350_t:CDS:2 [Funneliformis caledonium]|uniref:1350_t:CDS:1 n=1 Tax=Funneliformis caledonium TaxID=1117310 RepID=A0A9N8YZG4_9GLOM|nr:1350_t:CDS:2 [Funneliformis caledonium]